ncbi:MAG: hypothetical protein K0U47_01515 [Epsilonproteobacteria bacterium]|nr:hypothetical protein [Campylobacterota bacterium]
MEITLADIIGTSGVAIIVLVYFLLQIDKIDPKSLNYSLTNAIGSLIILYSLFHTWNLASVIIEIFWISISLFGVYKYYKRRSSLPLDQK